MISYTRAQLGEMVEAILAKHPMLRDYEARDCPCCTEMDLTDKFGHEVAAAWVDLDTWRWLAGS